LIFDGVTHVEPLHTPGYNFMTDMTDQAITWMRFQHTMTPDKPFFVYFAPGALHAPHHTPKEWRDKYAGNFDEGWDKYREETLERQKQLGVVPLRGLPRGRRASSTGMNSAPTRRGSPRG
jgi:arylsulfatase A-like enzyme